MLAEARRRLLLDVIARRGFATLDDLVSAVGVSESTIRRDLESLDREGVVKRTHGGALVSGDSRSLPAFDDRLLQSAAEKRAIGRAAAALVCDGDTILLDGGTTTLEVARALLGRPVQVVTNSLPIASLLATGPLVDLIMLGGYLYPRTGVALGPMAIKALSEIKVRRVMMGAGGIVPEGLYNQNSLLVDTERAMLECGQEIVVVADATKFGRQALTWLCDLSAVQRVVTDERLSEAHREMLARAGVALSVAALDGDAEPNGRAMSADSSEMEPAR